jgi:hypothetical protein
MIGANLVKNKFKFLCVYYSPVMVHFELKKNISREEGKKKSQRE